MRPLAGGALGVGLGVTGEVRVRVWGRVNNTRVGRGRGRVRVRLKHPQWLGSTIEGGRDRERCTGIRIREMGDGGWWMMWVYRAPSVMEWGDAGGERWIVG